VAEHHPLADRQEPLGRVGGRRRVLDAELVRRAPHEQRVVERLRGCHQQQQAGVVRERLEALHEALLDPPRTRVRARRLDDAGQLRCRERARQLQDRQRVATRLGDEPVAHPLVEPARDDGREQGARVPVGQPAERKLRQIRQLELVARLADREHDRHRLGQQPPCHEAEDLRRGRIEPLGVVDEAQQRPVAGDLGEQGERGQGDQEAVGSGTGCQAESDAQRSLLRLRKRADAVEHRRAQLVQPRERQLHLGLDPGDAREAEPRRLLSAMLQQRRLADSRLAADDEDGALTASDVLQQPVEKLTFAGSAQQHRRAARGHR
jgi:hypothetical protein